MFPVSEPFFFAHADRQYYSACFQILFGKEHFFLFLRLIPLLVWRSLLSV